MRVVAGLVIPDSVYLALCWLRFEGFKMSNIVESVDNNLVVDETQDQEVVKKPVRRKTREQVEPVEQGIVIARPNVRCIKVALVGTSPLIVHAWSEKARKQLLEGQQSKGPKRKRDPIVPKDEFNSARYVSIEGWDGVPSVAFKAAMVNSCRMVDGFPMTLARRTFFIRDQGVDSRCNGLVKILSDPPRMREDMVRLESGVASVRFRPEYNPWEVEIEIEFNADIISDVNVLNLLEQAGYSEGICEHRPGSPKSCTGYFGRFKVKRND